MLRFLMMTAIVLLGAHVAQACPPAQLERTFLDAIPDGAAQQQTVGRVQVLMLRQSVNGPAVDVQVTQPIRNLHAGQTFIVMPGRGDCVTDAQFVAPGKAYYIAGSLASSGVFTGPWKIPPKPADPTQFDVVKPVQSDAPQL